jgi:hypothetical protein
LKAGDIYTFKNYSRHAKDLNPVIIFVERHNGNILGVNLRYLPREYRDLVVKLVGKKIISNGKLNKVELNEILEREGGINERIYKREIISDNSDVSPQARKKAKAKRDTNTILKIMEKYLRTYRELDVKGLEKLDYQAYMETGK